LRRVTVNRAIDVLRQRRPQGDAEALPDGAPAHIDRVEDRELRDAVVRGLGSLSDAQRSVLVAKVYDGLTFTEIATELDIAVPTAKTHYLRALAAMVSVHGSRRIYVKSTGASAFRRCASSARARNAKTGTFC
jgi:RNA polymerase sigma-70 factor (ECF subfamily)